MLQATTQLCNYLSVKFIQNSLRITSDLFIFLSYSDPKIYKVLVVEVKKKKKKRIHLMLLYKYSNVTTSIIGKIFVRVFFQSYRLNSI